MLQPPVSPIGLEYIGEAVAAAGVLVRVLDLAFEADWQVALSRELSEDEPLVVGLSVRNTDDCCFATRRSFLPWIGEVVAEVRKLSQAFILLGGVGFSVMPDVVLRVTQADAGIAGDGEEVVLALLKSLAEGGDISHLPNLVYRRGETISCNPRADADLRRMPLPRRRLFDNRRYEQAGAIVGIETKRGCGQQCIFCADPLAKGSRVRLRPPDVVVEEFQDLLSQGVSWFHLCDSEFNQPIRHAKEVCLAIIRAGLGDRLRWYCYCSPVPFDRDLLTLMKRAGCAGINFGVDSLCDEQLLRLGRGHSTSDVLQLVHLLKGEEMNFLFDLLVGGPGESESTVKTTIEKVRELDIPLAGISAGVRIYPGTPLGKAIAGGAIKGRLYPETGQSNGEPLFYLSPDIRDDVSALIEEMVAGDPRFLVLASPEEEGSYNYADDEALSRLISEGARGAYWDIIRRSTGR
ncbi:B12-binding domain-containing radical SAM protein [Chloroflexota bacterium]